MPKLRSILACALVLSACSPDKGESGEGGPAFPADYASSYQEVRACRQSSEHDLNRIRVLADPAALEAYQKRDRPFPVGAVVLKEEYETADPDCSGPIKKWTVMQRLETGSAPDKLDWKWEDVGADRRILGTDTPRCFGCHTGCTPDAGGYEATCTVP